MPTFHMELPHRCSQQSAHACVDKTLGDLKVRYANYIGSTSIAWQGEAADFTIQLVAPAKVDIKGRATAGAQVVTLEGEYTLPMMLRAFPIGPTLKVLSWGPSSSLNFVASPCSWLLHKSYMSGRQLILWEINS
jgi:hypothetical protein